MLRIQITTGASQPIYRQIVDQVRHAVAAGKVRVGDAMPSVRALATELVVNPNTIAKAYSVLVRDGVIESQQGRGYFIAQRREIYTHKERKRRLGEVMDPFLAEAISLGFEPQQIIDEVEKRLRKTFSSTDAAPKPKDSAS
ncbi:MAG: GntR family transcriptional regulator [Rubripirellula sp.]